MSKSFGVKRASIVTTMSAAFVVLSLAGTLTYLGFALVVLGRAFEWELFIPDILIAFAAVTFLGCALEAAAQCFKQTTVFGSLGLAMIVITTLIVLGSLASYALPDAVLLNSVQAVLADGGKREGIPIAALAFDLFATILAAMVQVIVFLVIRSFSRRRGWMF